MHIQSKRRIFKELHATGTFVLPNPWDIGSLRFIEQSGAQAIATTSAGFAWSIGKEDYHLSQDEVLAHIRHLVENTGLPVNADYETGFGLTHAALADSIKQVCTTGVAGFSIEDRLDHGLYDENEAARRIAVSKEAAVKYGDDDMIVVARCEGLLLQCTDLETTIQRLQAYIRAGADVVYAPGLRNIDDIRRVVDAVGTTPVNVLLVKDGPTVAEMAQAGVRRISTGSRLAAAAKQAFEAATRSVLRDGHLPRS